MRSMTSHALLLSTLFIILCLFSRESHGGNNFLQDNDNIHIFEGRVTEENVQALFVFGDSYADTGNRNPYNQSDNSPWRRPYGISWPGFPGGRFSSGKIQTDYWAQILGLPSPIPYELLRSHDCVPNPEMIQGVNFAVGGSGIFKSYGYITVGRQVKQFKKLIARNPMFDSDKLSRSIVFISVGSNDYLSFLDSRNGSTEGIDCLVEPLVRGLAETVKELYELGLRNFALSNIVALGCLPEIGMTSCDSKYDEVQTLHTSSLIQSVCQLTSHLSNSSIIIPDLVTAYNHIFSNPTQYDLEELKLFMPCCAVKDGVEGCANVTETGHALFEVCHNKDRRFFWDARHPTAKGWQTLMSLYCDGFVHGAPSVFQWVNSLGFSVHNTSVCEKYSGRNTQKYFDRSICIFRVPEKYSGSFRVWLKYYFNLFILYLE